MTTEITEGSGEVRLPDGWYESNVLDCVEVIRGVTYSAGDAISIASPGYLPLLRANNFDNSEFVLNELVYVPEKLVSTRQRLLRGDIVVAMSSGSKRVVGKTASNNNLKGYTIGAFCSILRPTHAVSFRYLSFFLRSEYYRKSISNLSSGSNINNLAAAAFGKIRIPLPPLPEQERIAVRLDLLLGKRKIARKRLDAMPDLIKRFRKSVLAQAMSGRLTEEWRAEHAAELPSAEELLALVGKDRQEAWEKAELEKKRAKGKAVGISRTSYKADVAILDDFELPAPEGWIMLRLGSIGDIRLGKMLDQNKNSGKPRPYLGNINVRWFEFDLDHKKTIPLDDLEFSRFSLKKNDLLVCEGGEPGRCAVWNGPNCEYTFQKALHRIRTIDSVCPSYVAYWIRYLSELALYSLFLSGTTIRHLTGESIVRLPFVMPSEKEQSEIVRRVDELFAYAYALESRVAAARVLADRLEPAILAKAFRGELSEQIPEEAAEWEKTLAEIEKSATELGTKLPAKRGRKQKSEAVASETKPTIYPAKRKRGRPRKQES